MKRKNLLTVWAKRVLPMFAMVGAGLMAGCEKPVVNDEPYAEPIDPVKVLPFGKRFDLDSIQYDNVMKYANDPRITKIIYFVDSINNNDYFGATSNNISMLRKNLQERLDYTPKATGGGIFIFGQGEAAPADSLWFIQNNWEIRTR